MARSAFGALRPRPLNIAVTMSVVVYGILLLDGRKPVSAAGDAAALAAFGRAVTVFQHPRCDNCHAAGNRPTQGEDGRPHRMSVRRGTDGRGMPAMRCRNCHRASNQGPAPMPPGAHNWQMPAPDLPMAFAARSAGEICRQLKDPVRTRGRSLAKILQHLEEDGLVLWAWSPGRGRRLPPIEHDAFVDDMRAWVANGAACPK